MLFPPFSFRYNPGCCPHCFQRLLPSYRPVAWLPAALGLALLAAAAVGATLGTLLSAVGFERVLAFFEGGVGLGLVAAGLLFWPQLHLLWNTGRHRADARVSAERPESRHALWYCSDKTVAAGGKAAAITCSLVAIAAVFGMFAADSARVDLEPWIPAVLGAVPGGGGGLGCREPARFPPHTACCHWAHAGAILRRVWRAACE